MKNISPKRALLPVLLLAFTTGCPSKEEQANPLTPLRPNVSKTQPASTGHEKVSTTDSIAAHDPPVTAETPLPEGSGTAADVQLNPAVPPNVRPAVPTVNAPPAAALADPIPKYDMPIWKPSVVMSEAHQNTCVVQVGDQFPPLNVQTLAEELADTGELLTSAFADGKRLAVVVVWNADSVYGQEQFTRLQQELIEPFGNAGVQIVALHQGVANEETKQLAASVGDTLISLIDPDGSAFAKLATEKLPRTYLIDSQGKILWLDLEYSRGTRRDLRNAIMYHLTQQVAAAE